MSRLREQRGGGMADAYCRAKHHALNNRVVEGVGGWVTSRKN